jgi:hypothetical protein
MTTRAREKEQTPRTAENLLVVRSSTTQAEKNCRQPRGNCPKYSNGALMKNNASQRFATLVVFSRLFFLQPSSASALLVCLLLLLPAPPPSFVAINFQRIPSTIIAMYTDTTRVPMKAHSCFGLVSPVHFVSHQANVEQPTHQAVGLYSCWHCNTHTHTHRHTHRY